MTGAFRMDGRRVGWQLHLFGRAIAPPRERRAEAEADALALGHGSRDELSGQVYVTVPASIEPIFL